MTPEEVLKLLKKDTLFYRNSGGGITLSGGEPTQQAEFATELLRSCRQAGFHTTLDTCGYCKWEVLQGILRYVDLVLFDLKHMDARRHKELTGVSNKLILENARRMAQAGIQLIIRFPVIPGCNDSMDNVMRLGEFVSNLGVRRFDLLPYHKFALQKYEALGMDYRLKEIEPPSQDKIRDIKNALESFGLEISVAL
ncbi:putative [Formate-C-acetyltransferase]-activating enzyme [Georgfuchsia toluolica]|uniref:[Formate-C-acetyltransferase]-activating enzyme n=2 Tax=Georgfuchsia toluolica TaxID=424218 RepID=A0A916J6Y6_9PROT|nr:putative [Formate-C-acetyltransferase]-activating enzyme [Georgfuchsia toluolica]